MPPVALSTQGLVTYLQGLFGPWFLGIVGMVAIFFFFFFTREITRFVQFMVLAVAIAVVFYTPSIVQTPGGLYSERARRPLIPARKKEPLLANLPTYTNIWRIEKRLYKLYGFRLPAPWPITCIGVFTGITVPYVLFLIAVGLPFNHTLVWLYVLPPGVLTWLTTRPVIESKRLPGPVSSQLRYVAEPRTWCRMAPFAEKDEIQVSAPVGRKHRLRARAKRVCFRARQRETAVQAVVAGAVIPLAAARPVKPLQTTAEPSTSAAEGASQSAESLSSHPVMSERSHGELPVRPNRTGQAGDFGSRPSKRQMVRTGN